MARKTSLAYGRAMDEPPFLSGQFLLAMPGMGDPRFARAVIAMCAHDENGALGIGVGQLVAGLGAARRQLGRDRLDEPPDPDVDVDALQPRLHPSLSHSSR